MKAKNVAFTKVDFAAFQHAPVEPVYAAARTTIGSDFIDRILRSRK